MDVDDVHGNSVQAEIWRLSRVGARWNRWIMQTKSRILPTRSKPCSFVHAHINPSPIFSISTLPSQMWLWDATVVKSSPCWAFKVKCLHSMIPRSSANALFGVVGCCLDLFPFAMCVCGCGCWFFLFFLFWLLSAFGFFVCCGLSCCNQLVERDCKSPVVESVVVRIWVWILFDVGPVP